MEPGNSRMQQIKLQGAGIPFAGPMVRIRLPPAASQAKSVARAALSTRWP
jgi:hypothetical protein